MEKLIYNCCYIIGILLLFSCNERVCCYDVDTIVNIRLLNNEGVDLLNPNNEISFREQDISIFYLKNGEITKYFEGHLDASKGFHIFQNSTTQSYQIAIYPYHQSTINYIQWNEFDTDTLEYEFLETENYLVCTKVWFNSELTWESDGTERVFEVVK